jgi:hypothetical protein
MHSVVVPLSAHAELSVARSKLRLNIQRFDPVNAFDP